MFKARFVHQPAVADDLARLSTAGHGQAAVAAVTLPSADELAAVRGVTDAAAEISECACPDFCERDHANE